LAAKLASLKISVNVDINLFYSLENVLLEEKFIRKIFNCHPEGKKSHWLALTTVD
jgi:hypothetical protein